MKRQQMKNPRTRSRKPDTTSSCEQEAIEVKMFSSLIFAGTSGIEEHAKRISDVTSEVQKYFLLLNTCILLLEKCVYQF